MTNNKNNVGNNQGTNYRYLIRSVVRFLLLIIDVSVGLLLAISGQNSLMVPMEEGGPLSLELPTAILSLLAVLVGTWLVVSGVLLVLLKQPNRWRYGVWTHILAAVGIFLFIPVLYYKSQYELQVRPGHMAMEAAWATGIISIGIAIVGALWLISAGVLYYFYRSDR